MDKLMAIHLSTIGFGVSVHRAPHLRRSRALEVRTVRLRARRLAATAPCKRLLFSGLNYTGQINPVNGYIHPNSSNTDLFVNELLVRMLVSGSMHSMILAE